MIFQDLATRLAATTAQARTLVGVAVTDPDTGHVTVDIGGRVFPATVPASVSGVVQGVPVRVSTTGNALAVVSTGVGSATDWAVGDIKPFFGSEAQAEAQVGWVVMDGRTFSATTYPALYAHLGGTTTMPDATDRALMGAGATAAMSTGGTDTITTSHMPAHTHTVPQRTTDTFTASYGATFHGLTSGTQESGSSGSGASFRPKHLAVWFLMRAV